MPFVMFSVPEVHLKSDGYSMHVDSTGGQCAAFNETSDPGVLKMLIPLSTFTTAEPLMVNAPVPPPLNPLPPTSMVPALRPPALMV